MKPNILYRAAAAPSQGRPLLFVHGAFAGAWCWDEQFLPFFQKLGYDCFALNFRGHGADPVWLHLQLLGIEDYVQDLVWALQQCPEPPVLISHSMGGFVTLRLLQRQQVHLAGLILMSPASAKCHFESVFRLLRDFPLLCYKLHLMNASPKYLWPWMMTRAEVRRVMLSGASSLETSERLLPKMQHESSLAMMQMLSPPCAESPSLPCPALVLGGAEDVIVPPEFIRRTADSLTAEMRIVPAMGHSMMLEDGWPAAAELISQWLAGQAQPSMACFQEDIS
jgi:non-heme chloroperoxidase